MEANAALRAPRHAGLPSGWSRTLVAALGYGSLAALVALSGFLTLAAAAGPSFMVPANPTRFPSWIAGPLAGTGASLTGRGFVFILFLLFVAYAVALACHRRLARRVVVTTMAVLVVLFTLAPPLFSSDIFSYVAYARMGVIHGISPYVHGPLSIKSDPVIPYTHWLITRSVYGPVFTLFSYALAPLGLTATLWGLKAIEGLAAAALVGAVWEIARRLGRDPLLPAMIVGLNPVFLAYGVGGGHNDVLMLSLATLGVLGVVAGREAAGAAGLVASAAVKASTVIVAPFMLLGAVRRDKLVRGGVVAVAIVGAAGLIAFGLDVFGFLLQLEKHQSLTSTSSWPETLSGFFGHIPGVEVLGRVVLVLGVGGLLVATWRGTIGWIAAAGWALFLLAVTSPWLLAWYTFWPLPFAAV
ncbi:MAG: polyprenol phosphomannose-dependent alpha 1,6 mannosyltransferase MptB, partial [Actinomycetota bacterium]|nr:polyprenol phosphomannose-dependent alpha 1,6 mannosyltransferase MptB [Actinomycetota bacterium]